MSCGSWCVYFSSDHTNSACKNCKEPGAKYVAKLADVDPFELARRLKEKREQQSKQRAGGLSADDKLK